MPCSLKDGAIVSNSPTFAKILGGSQRVSPSVTVVTEVVSQEATYIIVLR